MMHTLYLLWVPAHAGTSSASTIMALQHGLLK